MIAVNRKRLTFMGMLACTVLLAMPERALLGQMINVGTPFRTNSDSYFGRTGIGFGMNFAGNNRIRGLNAAGQILPRVQLTQGSFGESIPGFGGYNPNSPLRTGFTTVGGDVGVSFGLEMGKGSRRSSVMQAPSVTMMNGQSASIFSGSQVPFVTQINPVIGMGANRALLMVPSAAEETVARYDSSGSPRTYSSGPSTATQGDISVAEIQQQRQQQEVLQDEQLQAELDELLSAAESLVAQGNYAAARAKYGRALRKIHDRSDLVELRQQLEQTLRELRKRR